MNRSITLSAGEWRIMERLWERSPRTLTELVRELEVERPEDFLQFVPPELEGQFTTKDFAKAAHISQALSQVTLNILYHMGTVARVGKKGNLYLYEANDF